jgi:hypothetical protein
MLRTNSNLKYFIFTFITLSLLCVLFDKILLSFFGSFNLSTLLGISTFGTQKYFFWQTVTYIFVEPSYDGLSFSFILNLIFSLYLINFMGKALIDQLGIKSFLMFSFSAIFIPGFMTYFTIKTLNIEGLILGPNPLIYALSVVWLAFFPQDNFMLLGSIKIKAKWFTFAFIFIGLLSALSEGHFLQFLTGFIGILTAYFYITCFLFIHSPFSFTRSIDKFLIKVGKSIKKIIKGRKADVIHGKIIDIRTLDDFNH